MPQNEENALYIDVERFNYAKQELKKDGKDCTDRKLSEILSCNLRTVQKYRSATNQFPIPLIRLKILAEYMDVSPEWLCGDPSAIGIGFKGYMDTEKRIIKGKRATPLIKYLKNREILKGDPYIYGLIWDYDNFTEISGVPVSYEQFSSYLDEIESAIEYITGRFIEHVKK